MSRFNGKRGRFSRFSLSTSSTPPSPFAYSWTVPWTGTEYTQYFYVTIDRPDTNYATTSLYSLNPRSVAGYPQTNMVKTFTISGLTGAVAAFNGKTITATCYVDQMESQIGFGVDFTNTWKSVFGTEEFVANPGVTFPGFTLNWN